MLALSLMMPHLPKNPPAQNEAHLHLVFQAPKTKNPRKRLVLHGFLDVFGCCKTGSWRRWRDSNPRYRFCPYAPLAGECLRPLGHISLPYFSKSECEIIASCSRQVNAGIQGFCPSRHSSRAFRLFCTDKMRHIARLKQKTYDERVSDSARHILAGDVTVPFPHAHDR